jgi:hypothetical protein
MNELDGSDLLGRPVKIKPGVVKSASERAQQRTGTSNGTAAPTGSDGLSSGSPRVNRTSPFNADRWRRDDASASAPSTPSKFNSSANGSGNGNANSDASKRLYVGGLPRLTDQETITSNITTFFKDYTMYVPCPLLPPPAIDGPPQILKEDPHD